MISEICPASTQESIKFKLADLRRYTAECPPCIYKKQVSRTLCRTHGIQRALRDLLRNLTQYGAINIQKQCCSFHLFLLTFQIFFYHFITLSPKNPFLYLTKK